MRRGGSRHLLRRCGFPIQAFAYSHPVSGHLLRFPRPCEESSFPVHVAIFETCSLGRCQGRFWFPLPELPPVCRLQESQKKRSSVTSPHSTVPYKINLIEAEIPRGQGPSWDLNSILSDSKAFSTLPDFPSSPWIRGSWYKLLIMMG